MLERDGTVLVHSAVMEQIAALYRVALDDALRLIAADPGEGSIRVGERWIGPPSDAHLEYLLREQTGCSGEVARWAVHRVRGRLPVRTPVEAWAWAEPLTPGDVRVVGRRPGDHFLLANRAGWSRFFTRGCAYLHFRIPLAAELRGRDWYLPPITRDAARAILAEAEEALAKRGPETLDRVRLLRPIDGFAAGSAGVVEHDYWRDGAITTGTVFVALLDDEEHPIDVVACEAEDVEIIQRGWLTP